MCNVTTWKDIARYVPEKGLAQFWVKFSQVF